VDGRIRYILKKSMNGLGLTSRLVAFGVNQLRYSILPFKIIINLISFESLSQRHVKVTFKQTVSHSVNVS
jgi:hypothetical protein